MGQFEIEEYYNFKRGLTKSHFIIPFIILLAFAIFFIEHFLNIRYLYNNLSLLTPLVPVCLAIITFLFIKGFFKNKQRLFTIGSSLLILLILIITTLGSTVNAYAGYYPTLAYIFGKEAIDPIPSNLATKVLNPSASKNLLESVDKDHQGKVLEVTIPNALSKFHANNVLVYLPPVWFKTNHPKLQVVTLMGGSPGYDRDWIQAGKLENTANLWAENHNGVAPVFVMPNITGTLNFSAPDPECVDGKLGNLETYITKDIYKWESSTFKGRGETNHMALAGFSLGGYCAMTLSLRHPQAYPIYLDISGESGISNPGGYKSVFANNAVSRAQAHDDINLLKTHTTAIGCDVVGSDENTFLRNQQIYIIEAAHSSSALYTGILYGQPHTWRYAAFAFQKTFPWLTSQKDGKAHQIGGSCI